MVRYYEGFARSLAEFQVVVFAALVVVGTALLLARPNNLDLVVYFSGAAIILLGTIATLIWRHNSLFQRFSLLLPLADIVGIRLTALADDSMLSGAALVLMLMLPIIWIAYTFGPWGFMICVGLVGVTSPRSFIMGYADFDANDFARLVAFPLTMIIMAAAAGVSGTRIRRKRAQLAEQTALTEQAVRARDDLIEAVTHELRTPLTSILGNAELLQRSSGQPQEVERRAGVIGRNAEQMDAILADLLLARSTGTVHLSLACSTTDLRGLIENSIAASRAAADAHGVSIAVTVSEALWADVDPNRIRQVLDNLLTNAIKYNRVGGTVTVSDTRSTDSTDSTDSVTLTVTDSGPGIAATDRERVFEPYYRTEAARSSSQTGTGLGLGISRDIARRHGGDLRLVDSSAAGTRFELVLPLAPAPAAAEPTGVSGAARK